LQVHSACVRRRLGQSGKVHAVCKTALAWARRGMKTPERRRSMAERRYICNRRSPTGRGFAGRTNSGEVGQPRHAKKFFY